MFAKIVNKTLPFSFSVNHVFNEMYVATLKLVITQRQYVGRSQRDVDTNY